MKNQDIGQFAAAGGRKIHYRLLHPEWLGPEKPLLVFLHEGLGSIGQWKDFPALLSKAARCPALVYDRYGYGLSEQLSDGFSPRFLHDEAGQGLTDLLDALGLSSQRLLPVGHSDGGSIALLFAALHPEKTAGVICEAAHVLVEPATRSGLSHVLAEFARPKFRELLGKYHGERTEGLVRAWVGNWLSEEARDWNITGYLPQITCPVLAIQGTEDHFGTYAQLEAIRSGVAGSVELLFLEGCGHVPHKEAKEAVLGAMVQFTGSLSGNKPPY
jgi:pimeloyl-ACP methyl ester carboxylesterase